MPRGSGSSDNIHSDYREPHETSSSTVTTQDSTLDIRYIHQHQQEYHPSNHHHENGRIYSNIQPTFDPSKNIIFTKFFDSTRANYAAYENLCSGCGYGVFEARGKLCNFCRYVVNGYLEDNSSNNIYENICDKCSELYSGTECSACSRNTTTGDKVNRTTDNDSSSSKSTSKKSSKKRLFHSLLGSLKRVKSFSVPVAPPSITPVHDVNVGKSTVRKKLEIIHNVDGYENVFRTNETFDLNRICELKRLKSSTSDHHIYGKLRKSDDHLQQVPHTYSYACVKQKSQSDDYLIGGGGGSGDEAILYHRTTSINTSRDSIDNDSLCHYPYSYLRQEQRSRARLERTIAIPVPRSVSVWLTSLRSETHEYYSFGAPDTVTCNPKSIPAVAVDPSAGGGSSSDSVTLRSFDDEVDFAQQMVNEFKRSLMERQEAAHGKAAISAAQQHLRARRQGIYLKLDNDDEHSIEGNKQRTGNYRADLMVGDDHDFDVVQVTTAQSPESSRRGLAHQLSKRCCIYEKDSEFVVDILQAFDSFLQRESPDDHDDRVVNTSTDDREPCADQTSEVKLDEKKSLVTVKSGFGFAPVLPQQIDFEAIFHQLALSKGLNKIVLCYDIPLKVFLSAVDQSAHRLRLRTPRSFRKFVRFQVLSLTRNKCNALPAIEHIPETVNSRKSPVMTVPNGSSTSHTKILADEHDDDDRGIRQKQKVEEEPIYQPIWKFKTVGEVQENYIYYTDDHLPRTCDSSAAITGADIEDHDEWEPDDEFTFTTQLDTNPELEFESKSDTSSVNTTQSSSTSSGSTITGYSSSVSTMTIASGSSVRHHLFRNICIFYSLTEPKIRAVLYDYDRNHCSGYFAQQQRQSSRQQLPPQLPAKRSGRGALPSADGVSTDTDSTCTSTSGGYHQNGGVHHQLKKPKTTSCVSESGCRMIPDSVQAWKYMLLAVNYLEDEEDMIVSENQILRAQTIKEMDASPPPVGILQRFKSISSGNLLDMPPEEDKKSITERMRDKLQRGVLKLQVRSPKENKKLRNPFRRKETTSLYLEDSIKPKYPIFNAPLEQLEMNETSYPDVPRFVVDCIEYIEQKDCIQMDGLYRASGNKVAVDELKQKLTESYIYDPKLLVTDDIHTLTSLLKQFFRELGAPLIPQDIYQRLATTRNLMESSAIESMKTAFKDMKNPNRATLKFLIKHLTTVAHYSNENRMPASNLAIVWGPCILSANQVEYDIARMNTLAKVLIENYDKIFGDNERLVS